MNSMKNLFFAFTLLSVLAGCSSPQEGAQDSSTEINKIHHPNVGIIDVKSTSFQHSFPVQGNVETDKNALIIPEFAGAIEKIFLKEGAKVRKGDAILQINDDVLQASRLELENSLDLAREMFSRQERIWAQEIGKEVDFLQAKSAVESLEKAIKTLDATIEKSIIRAPFSGVVDRIFVKTGELASPPMPCVRIINLNDLYVRAMVSDHYVGSVSSGDKVMVEIAGFDRIESKVRRVGSFINPANRSVDITVDLPNESSLIPNMIVTLWITDLDLEDAISLPTSLVIQDSKGLDFVFVFEKGKAIKRILETGITSEGKIHIISGLKEGDKVINRGGDRLMDGDIVNLIKDAR